jgi:hypothetical protein
MTGRKGVRGKPRKGVLRQSNLAQLVENTFSTSWGDRLCVQDPRLAVIVGAEGLITVCFGAGHITRKVEFHYKTKKNSYKL